MFPEDKKKEPLSRQQEFVVMTLVFLMAIPFVYLIGFMIGLVVWLFVQGWEVMW
jgi:hypothetical protein